MTLHLASSSGSAEWRLVIPPEHRQLFGVRIEDRYEQRLVCVAPATAGQERGLVTNPDQIVMTETLASSPLPDDVARTCDPDVRVPIVTRDVKPQYTADAMRAKVQGSIFLRAIVDRQGAVRDVRVLKSLEPSLDDSARKAFAEWKFRPAMRRGEAVEIAVSMQMTFTIR